MKNLFRHLFVPFFALTLTFSFVSCKKEGCIDPTADNYNSAAKKDDGSCTYTPVVNNSPALVNYCNYAIDGVSVTSKAFYLTNSFGSFQYQSYPVSAGAMPDMVIYLIDTITTGTYTNEGQLGFNYHFHYLTGTAQNEAYYGDGTNGSITITSHDLTNKTIEGTFSGTLYNSIGGTVTITNASFGFNY